MNRPPQCAAGYGYSSKGGIAPVGQSARVIVPILCRQFHPQSVLDVGCGTGEWLRAFLDQGVTRVRGYDGPWIPNDGLQIPADSFRPIDFYAEFPAPEPHDLAISLEVAEHVSETVAEKLIGFLCQSARVVCFSGAIPGQGGYEHINEHYQEYWIDCFKRRGFGVYDSLRPQIWLNNDVAWYYQQNCFLFANEEAKQHFGLQQAPFMSSLVHPVLYEHYRDPKNYSLKAFARNLPHYLKRSLTNRKWF